MTYEKFRVNGGDVLEVEWTGSVHVAPTTGAQFAHASDAMRCELGDYLRACGEFPEDIDDCADLVLDDHGEWID